jgi:hypothetical protein
VGAAMVAQRVGGASASDALTPTFPIYNFSNHTNKHSYLLIFPILTNSNGKNNAPFKNHDIKFIVFTTRSRVYKG